MADDGTEITRDWLLARRACDEHVALFEATFGAAALADALGLPAGDAPASNVGREEGAADA